MQGRYWERHPTQVALLHAFLAGEWVTRSFGWFSMMVSRFAGPVMTIAVGYLILYAIDSHHGLSTVVSHPTIWDSIAQVASGIINVTPELVFPGTVVLSIQALLRRSWLHGALYATASLMFAVLTILLLQAYMTGGLTDSFLSDMLLWRAVSALSYTVVAEVCSHHDQGHASAPAPQPIQDQQARLDHLTEQVHHLTDELSHLTSNLQDSLQQRVTLLAENMHVQLASELAALKASLQQEQEKLAGQAFMKAQPQARIRTTQPLEVPRSPVMQAASKRPLLRAIPTGSSEGQQQERAIFDARAFVFSCLQDHPDAKLAEIERFALAAQHPLSQATISRYRKQFLARCASSLDASRASASMQAESAGS